MLKHSKQRDCIKAFLKSRSDHPTAETVFLNIRHEFPKISLATVYRNLSLLADLGEIQKISAGSGPDRFDAVTAPHNHFVCSRCGNVMDLEMDSIANIDEVAGRTFQGRIEGHTVYFYGQCPDCLAGKKAETS